MICYRKKKVIEGYLKAKYTKIMYAIIIPCYSPLIKISQFGK